MRRILFIVCSVILIFSSCREDQNSVSLPTSAAVTGFLPDFSSGQYFASNLGDTIRLWQIESTSFFEKSTKNLGLGSDAMDLDFVEIEQNQRIVGNDTIGVEFTFNLNTVYNAISPRLSDDILTVVYENQNMSVPVSLSLIYTDTLLCTTDYCSYNESLTLYSNQFSDVYFTTDPTTNYTLYINSTYGLVGFRNDSSTVYELIP